MTLFYSKLNIVVNTSAIFTLKQSTYMYFVGKMGQRAAVAVCDT